eukprot:6968375-Prymnesium_polylepis.1
MAPAAAMIASDARPQCEHVDSCSLVTAPPSSRTLCPNSNFSEWRSAFVDTGRNGLRANRRSGLAARG